MKKGELLISILYLSVVGLFAQEYVPIDMILTEDTPAWDEDISFKYSYNQTRVFPKETVVQVLTGPFLSSINMSDDDYIYFCIVSYESKIFEIPAKSLNLLDNTTQFPDSLVCDQPVTKYWTCSYYLDVLDKKNRDVLYKHAPLYIEERERYALEAYTGEEQWWQIESDYSRYILFQSSISFGSSFPIDFWIIDKTYKNGEYRLTIQGDADYFERKSFTDWKDRYPIPTTQEKQRFVIRLKPDGDYVELYLENEKKPFATYVRMDKTLELAILRVINIGEADNSGIVFWPRRADGSMDYLPPKDAKNIRFSPTAHQLAAYPYITTSNLRLRSSATTSSNIGLSNLFSVNFI